MTDIQIVLSERDIQIVADLAREIWHEHYVPIIGAAQVEYMLGKFQCAEAITRQISDGYEYFLIKSDGEPAGYLGVIPDVKKSSLMISKIYVKKSIRGAGLGRSLLDFAEKLCQERGISSVWLTVNKNNARSIAWYEHVGFHNAGAISEDIGNGFIMDDFKMVKSLSEH